MQISKGDYGGGVKLNTEIIRQYKPGTKSQEFLSGSFWTEINVENLTFEEVMAYLKIKDQVVVIDK